MSNVLQVGDTREWSGESCFGDERAIWVRGTDKIAIYECMSDGRTWRVIRFEPLVKQPSASIGFVNAKKLIGQIADMLGVPKRIAWLRVTCNWDSDELPLIEYRLAGIKKEESPQSL